MMEASEYIRNHRYNKIDGYSLREISSDMPLLTLLACDRCHAFVDHNFTTEHSRWCT